MNHFWLSMDVRSFSISHGQHESFLVTHPWMSDHFQLPHGWHELFLVTCGCECCDPFRGKERKAETLLGQGKWSELEVAVMTSIRSGLVIYEILASLIWVFLLFIIKVLFSPFIFSISQIQLILRHTRGRVAPELVSRP
jgi:hypothetical protein